MRSFAPSFMAVALSLLATSCGEPLGPDTATVDASDALESVGGSVVTIIDNPGPFVSLEGRGKQDYLTGRNVVIANDPRGRCSGAPTPPDYVEIERRTLPSGEVLEKIKGTGLRAQIWGFSPFDCDRVLAEGPIAEGLVDLTATNYFQYWFGNEPKNFEFNAHGAFTAHLNCTRSDGGYHCNVVLRENG